MIKLKNLIIITTFLLYILSTACSVDEFFEDASSDSCSQIAKNQTIEKAVRAAYLASETLGQENSRGLVRVVNENRVYPIRNTKSRSCEDTLMLVVNFEDENGFAIVDVTEKEGELLAFVPEGSYNPGISTDNPGFNHFVESSILYTQSKIIERDSTKHDFQVFKTVRDTIFHYLQTPRLTYFKWGQGGMYGKYAKNGIAGCAPLAMTKLILYFNFQEKLNRRYYYNFKEADIPYEDIDWAEVMRHRSSGEVYWNTQTQKYESNEHICWQKDTIEGHKTLARIIRQVGKDCGADYEHKDETGASKVYYKSTLKKNIPGIGVSDLTSFDFNKIRVYLDKGLVLMRADGYSYTDSDIYIGGHVWVTDAYQHTKIHEKNYERDMEHPDIIAWKFVSERDKMVDLLHFIWGWYGAYDGWFSGNVYQLYKNVIFKTPEFIAISNSL